MKFLKDEEITKEANGVKVTFSSVTTSQQSAMITLATDKTLAGRVRLAELIIKNYITKLEIHGEQFDPLLVAEKSDLSDPATVDGYFQISALFMDEMTIHNEAKKKSKEPGLLTDQKNDAGNVQTAPKEGQPANV